MGLARCATPAATRILRGLVGVCALFSGTGFAYTLTMTTCDYLASTTGEDIEFSFCQGGTYCSPTFGVEVTSSEGLNEANHTVEVPFPGGNEPTTVVISNPGNDGWCMNELSWEGGGNLMGELGGVWLDSHVVSTGPCVEGLPEDGSPYPCQESWRFFNLNGADAYTYDIEVTACQGTKSAIVHAAFCSNSWCSTDYGKLVNVTLTMDDVKGGQTNHEAEFPFNPLAVKLFEVDRDWCADKMTFNGYTIIAGTTSVADFDDALDDGTRTLTIPNIQYNGLAPTESPTMSPTSAPTEWTEPDADQVPIVAAWVAGLGLLAVLVATCACLARHCAAKDINPRQSCEALCTQRSFWGAMVVWAGLFVTLMVLNFGSTWRILSACAAAVLWFVIMSWFVVFRTEPRPTGSSKVPPSSAVSTAAAAGVLPPRSKLRPD